MRDSVSRGVSRREFLASAAMGVGWAAVGMGCASPKGAAQPVVWGERNRWRISHPLVREPIRLIVAGDSHLTLDDGRGSAWAEYSKRMSTAYRVTRHWQTGREVRTPDGFLEVVKKAQKVKADLLAHVGDAVSFPSEAGVEFLKKTLDESGVRWAYVSGNHDWHYEGLPGTLADLRAEWAPKRLGPLYQGENPLVSVHVVKGVRMVFVDDSIWEILPEQLAFVREQIATGDPVAIFLHIPLYVKGGKPGVCEVGDPSWGWDTDPSYKPERRPRWPKAGHTAVTYAFRDLVFSSANVVGVFAGHTHVQMSAVENGVPQLVTELSANGGHLDVEILPA